MSKKYWKTFSMYTEILFRDLRDMRVCESMDNTPGQMHRD